MNITTLSPKQLRAAADLKERIDALQEQLNAILGGGEIAAPVAPEAAAKPKNGRRKRRKKVSAEGRANISAAAKASWAARRGETTVPAAEPVKRKRRISRALRQARSEAMKAMWARARRAGKSRL